MNKSPSELDIRAAIGFQALAQDSYRFSVTCRFKRVKHVPSWEGDIPYARVEHIHWPRGMEEFHRYFGSAPKYFVGALEYVRLATGWTFPHYGGLEVKVLDGSKHKISGGLALHFPYWAPGSIHISWSNGEFTETVLHELIHVFKKGKCEAWVEQQALRLTLGV